jgi:hypothetical protein
MGLFAQRFGPSFTDFFASQPTVYYGRENETGTSPYSSAASAALPLSDDRTGTPLYEETPCDHP